MSEDGGIRHVQEVDGPVEEVQVLTAKAPAEEPILPARQSTPPAEEPVDTPVIVVGGGGCGLSLSAFLSDYGIEHYLFERHSGTSILPKAHLLNQRTVETFRLHSMNDELQKATCPLRHMSQVAWATTLGGDGPLDRQIIHKYGCFGGEDGSTRAKVYE